jgi:molecular chaperone GrpE
MTDDDTFDPVDEYEGLSDLDAVTPEEAQVDGLGPDGPAEAAEFIEPDAAGGPGPGERSGEGRHADADDDPEAAFAADEHESEQLAEAIDTEIHELAAERDQFKDIALRLQADFDNYRKRMSTHTAGEVDRATGKLAEALLPVLDAAEAAYVQHPDEVGPLLNLMLAELRKHGLESIDLLDKPFDPNLADAVAHEPGEGGEPVVAEVLRSGYSWNGRTLRPAMVRTRD